jgi:hypothetical protein
MAGTAFRWLSATRPPGLNSLQQLARFDDFAQEFNTERPQEALAMKCQAEIYSASSQPYSGLSDLTYPLHDRGVLARYGLMTTLGSVAAPSKIKSGSPTAVGTGD